MPHHTIEPGECLASLAARTGRSAKQIHEHAQNASLRTRRPHLNILAPGDVIFLEPAAQKAVRCSTEEKHRFIVKIPKLKLRLSLRSARGEPYEDKRFAIIVNGKAVKGRTGPGGLVDVDVRATACSARLQMWLEDDDEDPLFDRDLAIGHLDPIDTVKGVQARLANLGHPCAVTGAIDDATLTAARLFRARHELPAIDDPRDADDEAEEGEEDALLTYSEKLIDGAFRERLQERYEGKAG